MSGLNDRLFVRLAVFGVLAMTLALAGCGRKGALELPPQAAAEQKAKAEKAAQARKAAGQTASVNQARRQKPKRTGQDRPFFLDPLID